MSVQPTYHALKNLHEATTAGGGLLPSPWAPEDERTMYGRLIEFFPVDTKVTALYPSKANLETFKTFEGVITGSAAINRHEPHFHIQDERGFTILLPGSLLTAA